MPVLIFTLVKVKDQMRLLIFIHTACLGPDPGSSLNPVLPPGLKQPPGGDRSSPLPPLCTLASQGGLWEGKHPLPQHYQPVIPKREITVKAQVPGTHRLPQVPWRCSTQPRWGCCQEKLGKRRKARSLAFSSFLLPPE